MTGIGEKSLCWLPHLITSHRHAELTISFSASWLYAKTDSSFSHHLPTRLSCYYIVTGLTVARSWKERRSGTIGNQPSIYIRRSSVTQYITNRRNSPTGTIMKFVSANTVEILPNNKVHIQLGYRYRRLGYLRRSSNRCDFNDIASHSNFEAANGHREGCPQKQVLLPRYYL